MTKEIFKALFDQYFDSVRSYLYYRGADKEQASDIAQDVFLRIWEKQPDEEPVRLKNLLYKMANDLFISQYRRQKLESNYVQDFKSTDIVWTPEAQLQYDELFTRYIKALSIMGENQRVVFLMARMDGMKYHEIAECLNLSVKAVEKRMNIALKFLKRELEV